MNYDKLRSVFAGAINQASEGKGAIRHGSGEPFEKQQICEISRRLAGRKCAGPLFQAVKKITEWARLNGYIEKVEVLTFVAGELYIKWMLEAGAVVPLPVRRSGSYVRGVAMRWAWRWVSGLADTLDVIPGSPHHAAARIVRLARLHVA